MPERFDRGLQPDFGGEPAPEGAAEKEYQVEMSDNDWATINYLALGKIEKEALSVKHGEEWLKESKSHHTERGNLDHPNIQSTMSSQMSAIEKEKIEAIALNDMLTRWQEAGAPVIAKQDKADMGYGHKPEPRLPRSWREGIGTPDPKDYPQDGSSRVLKKVFDGIGDEELSQPQVHTVPAQPDDWERVRGLLQEAKAVHRDKIGRMSDSDKPDETYVDMSSFGRSYLNAAHDKEAGIKQPEPWENAQIITYGESGGRKMTEQEEMEMVNSRLAEIEGRLPE